MKPAWWLGIAAIAGLAIGAAWPPPPIPKAQQAGDSAWSLPAADALRRVPANASAQVSQGIHWAGETGGAGEAGSQGPWKLTGIVRGPGPAALVQQATGKIGQYSEGEPLPDGSLLVRIEGDDVTIERNGCRQIHQLHRPRPPEGSGCIAGQK